MSDPRACGDAAAAASARSALSRSSSMTSDTSGNARTTPCAVSSTSGCPLRARWTTGATRAAASPAIAMRAPTCAHTSGSAGTSPLRARCANGASRSVRRPAAAGVERCCGQIRGQQPPGPVVRRVQFGQAALGGVGGAGDVAGEEAQSGQLGEGVGALERVGEMAQRLGQAGGCLRRVRGGLGLGEIDQRGDAISVRRRFVQRTPAAAA